MYGVRCSTCVAGVFENGVKEIFTENRCDVFLEVRMIQRFVFAVTSQSFFSKYSLLIFRSSTSFLSEIMSVCSFATSLFWKYSRSIPVIASV